MVVLVKMEMLMVNSRMLMLLGEELTFVNILELYTPFCWPPG